MEDTSSEKFFGQLANVARLFAQFYAGTRKSHQEFWPPLLEQPIKLEPGIRYMEQP